MKLENIIKIIRDNKKKILLIVLVIGVVVGVIYYLNTQNNDEKEIIENEDLGLLEDPLIFAEDDKLVYVDIDTLEKIVLEEDYDIELQDSLQVSFANDNTDLFAYTNGSELYLYNLVTNEKEKIATNMQSDYSKDNKFYFITNDEYIIFQDDDNNFYTHNIKENTRDKIYEIDYDEKIIIDSTFDDKIIFSVLPSDYNYGDDYNYHDPYNVDKETYIFTIGDNNSLEKVASDIDLLRVNTKEKYIFYSVMSSSSGKSTYYKYDINSKDVNKIIVDVDALVYYNSDYTEFVYFKDSGDKYDIIEDDLNGKDYITSTREINCGENSYYYYYYNYCTYEQYMNDEVVSIELELDVSDKITEINNYNNQTTYDVYKYSIDEEEELLVSNVIKVLGANYDNNSIIYQSIDDSKKIKMTEILSALEDGSTIYDYFDKYNVINYMIGNENEILNLDENVNLFSANIMNNNDVYFYSDEGSIYYMNTEDFDIKNVASDVDAATNDGVIFQYYVSKDYNDDSVYDVKFLENGVEIKSFTDVMYSYSFGTDTYYYHSCKWNSCDVSSYSDSDKILYEDVYNVQIIDSETELVLKNYSDINGTVDIYKSYNGELEKIAIDIPMRYLSLSLNGFHSSSIGI